MLYTLGKTDVYLNMLNDYEKRGVLPLEKPVSGTVWLDFDDAKLFAKRQKEPFSVFGVLADWNRDAYVDMDLPDQLEMRTLNIMAPILILDDNGMPIECENNTIAKKVYEMRLLNGEM